MLNRVRVPAELKPTAPNVLEDYVRLRITQFVSLLSQRLGAYAPGFTKETLDRAAAEVLTYLPPGDHGQLSLEDKQLQLVFRHDCLALGCLDPQCALCTHNPSRRCTVNFDRKYLVNDVLKARCGAGIRVELIDPLTAQPVEEKLPEITLQISVLDGNLYDNKFLDSGKQYEGGTEPAEELDACALLQNKKKSTPLLVCGSGGSNDAAGYVLLSMVDGKVPLNDLHVTDSSEAILSGRKPPFRLLVRALLPHNGPRLNIRHAVSEGFVVATRRTRTAGKADIPSVDDPVSKLEHMGKETVKKLADLATAAEQAGVEIDIPENCVQKVGEFKMLALRADQDGHLRQKLQHVLKLSKEKWDEARDHAMRAVVADNRMRAWYADRRSCELGVLFTARMGNVDLERPVGLLQTRMEAGERKTEAILVAQLNPTQREMLRHMQPQAVAAWWALGHTGWAIFPMDSDTFLQTGTLTAAPAPAATLTTAATAAAEPPSSPTQSAVSLSTMSQRRHTGGSGGGDGGIGAGLSMGCSQTADMIIPSDNPSSAKAMLQPALPSAPASLGSGVGLTSIHLASHALNSGNSLPTAFGAGLPTAFGAGLGSGRSSRAGSMTDSPPPSHRMSAQPLQMQQPQSQLSLSHHHSLPQPPQSQQLQQHTSLQGCGNLPQLPNLQQLSSYHSHGSMQVHSVMQQQGMQGQSGVQQHPGLQQHPSLQQHSSLQHAGLQQHPNIQQHASLQQHPGHRQSNTPSAVVAGGRAGSFSGMPSQSPHAMGGIQQQLSVDAAPLGGLPSGQGGTLQHQQPQSHLMPPPPPPSMGSGRSVMPPPSAPPTSYRMPPPSQPPQQQHTLQHPQHHGHFRQGPGETYQQGHLQQQGQLGLPIQHLGPHVEAMQHGMHPAAGLPRPNGCTLHAQSGQLQHHGMQRRQSHEQAQQQHMQQQVVGRPPLSGQQGPGLGDMDSGQGQPPQLAPAHMRMGASGGMSQGQVYRQNAPLPLPVARASEDTTDGLQSQGSANPRPYKMPSLGRPLDANVMAPPAEAASKGEAVTPAAASSAVQHVGPLDPKEALGEPASGKENANLGSGGGAAQAKPPQFSAPLCGASSSGLPTGPRAAPPVPGQSPPGASPPPPGPPPNPFARVQSNKNGPSAGGDSDDSDSDDSLGLGALPLTSSLQMALGAPSVGGNRLQQHGANADGALTGGGGAGHGAAGGGGGQLPNGGLHAPLPSLHMIDSQQLEMVLNENLIYETSSLNTGVSGLFLPPAMALPDGIGMLGATQSKELLKPTSSGLLKPTTSGLDTMASMELALPGVRKTDTLTVGQEPKASGGAGTNVPAHASAPAAGVVLGSNRMLGPYAR